MSEELKKCPYCAEMISAEAKKCKFCGETLDATLRELEALKAQQNNNNGPVIVNNNNNNNNGMMLPVKSKIAALLLCFFFGCLGAHRFYVGKAGSGILYFLTGGICGIGAFIDFFIILFGGFTDSFGRPLKQFYCDWGC